MKLKLTVGNKPKLRACDKGWECSGSVYRSHETVTDYFQVCQFENLFSKRNAPAAHALGSWDYQSFIAAAAALFVPFGFDATGDK